MKVKHEVLTDRLYSSLSFGIVIGVHLYSTIVMLYLYNV